MSRVTPAPRRGASSAGHPAHAVLICGGAGFLGSHRAERLLRNGLVPTIAYFDRESAAQAVAS